MATAKQYDTPPNPMGRPRKIDDAMVRNLLEGFAKGLTDRECCVFTGLAESTLYDYCRENPDFSKQKELLKANPVLKAKLGLESNLTAKNPKICLDYLERRDPKHFSKQSQLLVSGGVQFEHITDNQLYTRIAALQDKLQLPGTDALPSQSGDNDTIEAEYTHAEPDNIQE